ncbi:hypothetical protein [Streptomyces sp. NPDC056264]|uniref:hypothetical protein n=1 Tax=Streptomyces sp. NPDC056264 TaxID=3345767 RepID=UPI003AACBC0E
MTIEKMPSITELTASHPIRGEGVGVGVGVGAGVGVDAGVGKPTSPEWRVVFVEAMSSVP